MFAILLQQKNSFCVNDKQKNKGKLTDLAKPLMHFCCREIVFWNSLSSVGAFLFFKNKKYLNKSTIIIISRTETIQR